MNLNSKSLTETLLDWFELNPTATARSGPLSKALKIDIDKIADGLARLAAAGKLTRCKIEVPKDDRLKGSPVSQWEYRLPAGALALTEVKPYVPAKTVRRADLQNNSNTQTGCGDVTPADSKQASHVVGGARHTDTPPAVESVAQPAPHATEEPAVSENDEPSLEQRLAELEATNKALMRSRQADELALRVAKKRISDLETAIDLTKTASVEPADETPVKPQQPSPSGYLVRAPKRKPQYFKDGHVAMAKAHATARAAGEAELLALVPLGRATRSPAIEWKDA